MNLSEHLLKYEETSEYVEGLFDAVCKDLHRKKASDGDINIMIHTCMIDTVLSRMGVDSPVICYNYINITQPQPQSSQPTTQPTTQPNDSICDIHRKNKKEFIRLILKSSKLISSGLIPPLTTVNINDPRCGRIPLARDIITNLPSLGLYNLCTRRKQNYLGCSEHYCRHCYHAERQSLTIFLLCIKNTQLYFYKDILHYIRRLSIQRVRVHNSICIYTNKVDILTAAIYNCCPRRLQNHLYNHNNSTHLPTCMCKDGQICDSCLLNL